jgi:hypothetical protein
MQELLTMVTDGEVASAKSSRGFRHHAETHLQMAAAL